MKKQRIAASLLLALGVGVSQQAQSQANPNQLISARKGAMTLQAKYFSPVLAMSLGRAPYDSKIVQRNVEYLAVLNQMPWEDFQPHTAGNPNTRAKEEIYKDPAKFKAATEKGQAEVQNLLKVVRSGGDRNAVKPAAQAVSRACNSCHESFATFDYRFPVE
jgi:cytochrome c556